MKKHWYVMRRTLNGIIGKIRDDKLHKNLKKILLDRWDYCALCNSQEDLQLDHIKPIILGGQDLLNNVQLLCKYCHKKKTKKDLAMIAEFRYKCEVLNVDFWADDGELRIKAIADEVFKNNLEGEGF